MEKLTVLGGRGFLGSQYVKSYYDQAVGNIASINPREDYCAHSKDVLYFISTVTNYNVWTDPYLDISTNLTTLIKTLESWRQRPDSKDGVFNFISSWFVYGEQEDPHGVPEYAPCNPKGFYSITKRCAEQLLISYCETYGLKYRILRLANVVGQGDKKVSAQKNALQYLIERAKHNEDIQIYGDGNFFRDYIHVEDCTKAIQLVLGKGNTNTVYNIGNGKTWPFKDIIMYAYNKLSSVSPIKYIVPKAFHRTVQIRSMYLDNGKLRELGYEPKYTGETLYNSLL